MVYSYSDQLHFILYFDYPVSFRNGTYLMTVVFPIGEMGGSLAKGPSTGRNRSFKGDSYRKEKEKGLEENGYKSLFCWRWLY